VLRPFSSHRATEIVAAPKVYAFDTGFVCFCKGWRELRKEDQGLLWEHFVLNEMQANMQSRRILYWRDKRQHEVDFVIPARGGSPTAIECVWSSGQFDPSGLRAFRRQYPRGENFVVASDVDRSFQREYGELRVAFVSLAALVKHLAPPRAEKTSDA
jgi:uncharacterized protein